jgi:lysophospholipase L1-like esterase
MTAMKAAIHLLHVIASVAFCCSVAPAQQAEPLRDAVECNVRRGLPNVFAKWWAGKPVRVGYLGGSITAQNGWRPKTLAWFNQQHPNSTSVEINAAIGGTGSDLGVFRLRQDVLDHKPDLLFVEFAVNDGGSPTDRILKAMEGIVRQTWRADPTTDICFVYTLTEGMLGDLDAGKFPHAASVMEQVADRYGIPSIHMGLEVAHLHRATKLIFTGQLPKTDADRFALNGTIVFSPDGVHPYETTGHELYLAAIKRSFAQIEQAGVAPGPHTLPQPLVADNWEQAKLVPLSAVSLSQDWRKLEPSEDRKADEYRRYLPGLWKANRAGASMTIRFKGTSLLVYDLLGPDCGQVSVQVDNLPAYAVSRFDAYCLYHRLGVLPVADSVPFGVHTVCLRILPDQPDKLKILHQRKENAAIATLDPKVYNDTAWYAGAILLVGDLIPPDPRRANPDR